MPAQYQAPPPRIGRQINETSIKLSSSFFESAERSGDNCGYWKVVVHWMFELVVNCQSGFPDSVVLIINSILTVLARVRRK